MSVKYRRMLHISSLLSELKSQDFKGLREMDFKQEMPRTRTKDDPWGKTLKVRKNIPTLYEIVQTHNSTFCQLVIPGGRRRRRHRGDGAPTPPTHE